MVECGHKSSIYLVSSWFPCKKHMKYRRKYEYISPSSSSYNHCKLKSNMFRERLILLSSLAPPWNISPSSSSCNGCTNLWGVITLQLTWGGDSEFSLSSNPSWSLDVVSNASLLSSFFHSSLVILLVSPHMLLSIMSNLSWSFLEVTTCSSKHCFK